MRIIFSAILSLVFLYGCAASGTPNAGLKSKGKSAQSRTEDAADRAFSELECENSGATCKIPPYKPSGDLVYDRTTTAADKAFQELDCTINGTCLNATVDANKMDVDNSLNVEPLDKVNPLSVENKARNQNTKYPLENGRPIWLLNPYYDGYLGGVGYAKPQARGGYSTQRRVAVSIAQAEISKSIKVLVESEFTAEKNYISSRISESYDETYISRIKESSNELLNNTVVLDEWTDKVNNVLYVWVVLNK